MPRLSIDRFWDGPALPDAAHASISLRRSGHGAEVLLLLDAPFHGDPPPAGPAGSTERLWESEVVELFIAGDDGRYLEVELGPGGHHLVLSLSGTRRIVVAGMPLDYRVRRLPEGRFEGVARLPAAYLPDGALTANAYAIHAGGCGREGHRCYHAHAPVPGPEPDFHQLDRFVQLPAGAWR